ncbi:MAG TPA: FAD/NAD(P)-binding protein [Pseudomonadales bacterium]|nr:FAD/NAD(P)-binding protein [Pseudomonadales bacterium]
MTFAADTVGTRILVIGAGFCGTLVAAHLLRAQSRKPIHVMLVDRRGAWARGVAYGTRTPAHVLNVPAGRMSAFPDDEDHFLRFAQARDYSISGGSFVPRSIYGEYLEHVLTDAKRGRAAGSTLQQILREATDITVDPDGAEAEFTNGWKRRFDRVVLAVGNSPPAESVVERTGIRSTYRYVADPWAPAAFEQVDPDEPVLLLGTGLTMLDVALDLHQRGLRAPMIALSRHGLLPQAHRAATAAPSFAHRPPDILSGAATALAYLRSVRRYVAELAPTGVDWREVLTSLRPITPRLWSALAEPERARFLRHVRAYWETHRHRAAPLPFALLQRLIENGELTTIAGRLDQLDTDVTGITARIVARGGAVSAERYREFRVGSVVNCTGPQTDIARLDDPLLGNLLQRGSIRADPLHCGVDVTDDLALVDGTGVPSRSLYYIGPLLRARFWEATAVPELRVHAMNLARRLAEGL